MSKQTRYLLTVDSATGVAVKLECLGEAGDLTEVPLSTLGGPPMGMPGAGAPLAPQSLVINIYMGGTQPSAPLSISLPGPGAPGGPGTFAPLVAPGAPGSPGTTEMQGPGGPGASAASTLGQEAPDGKPGGG